MGGGCAKCSKDSSVVPLVEDVDANVSDSSDIASKVKLHTAIKKNDAFLVKQTIETTKIPLNENIGKANENQTPLHTAAIYNCDNSMKSILEYINSNQSDKIAFYLGLRDSDGNNPVMACAYNDAPDALVVIFDYLPSLNINQRNKSNETLIDVAKKNSLVCLNLLNFKLGKNEAAAPDLLKDQQSKQQQIEKLEEKIRQKESEANQKQKEAIQNGEDNSQVKQVENEKLEAQRLREQLKRDQAKTQRTTQDVINAQKAKQSKPSNEPQLKYKNLLQQFQGKNPLTDYYQDAEFPARVDSITKDQNHDYYKKYFVVAPWARPNEILKTADYTGVKLFDAISPSDILQGLLGVCYFLSSMSAIAEFPSRLCKIFNSSEANGYGVYSVTLYDTGVPTEIIVDDRFPCYQDKTPLFSKPKGNEIWALVLEKAWAKLFGNYCVTEAGVINDAFDALLGAGTELVQIGKDTKVDNVWNDFSSWEKENYVMCCATGSKIDKDKTGLVPGHAYTIIAAYDIENYRLLKIRNPWGQFEWKGDFSDSSPLWNDDLKRAVGYANVNDGVFCMTVDDFVKNMDYYAVSYFRDNYSRSYQEVQSHRSHPEYFEFTLVDSCCLNIQVLQKDKRHFEEKDGYKYSPVEMILAKKDGKELNIISTNQGYWGERSYSLREKSHDYISLEAGEYILRAKVLWQQKDTGTFTLVCNSEKPVSIARAQRDSYKTFLKAILLPSARRADGKNDLSDNCTFSSGWVSPYMFCYVKNSGTGTLKLAVELTKSSNIVIPKRFSNDGKTFTMNVPGNSEELYYLKKQVRTGGGSVSWSFNSEYSQ